MSSKRSILRWILLVAGGVLFLLLGLVVAVIFFFGPVYIEDENSNRIIYGSNDGRADVTPYVIYSKPRTEYTETAIANHTEGTVRLKITFLSTGEIGNIHVVESLPDGLTEQAVEAARKIKFTPKVVNGEPVSMIMTFDYVFRIE